MPECAPPPAAAGGRGGDGPDRCRVVRRRLKPARRAQRRHRDASGGGLEASQEGKHGALDWTRTPPLDGRQISFSTWVQDSDLGQESGSAPRSGSVNGEQVGALSLLEWATANVLRLRGRSVPRTAQSSCDQLFRKSVIPPEEGSCIRSSLLRRELYHQRQNLVRAENNSLVFSCYSEAGPWTWEQDMSPWYSLQ